MKNLALLFACISACSAEPTPTPTPEIPKTQWLISGSTDPAHIAGAKPGTTFFISKNEVIVIPFGEGFLITFKPKPSD